MLKILPENFDKQIWILIFILIVFIPVHEFMHYVGGLAAGIPPGGMEIHVLFMTSNSAEIMKQAAGYVCFSDSVLINFYQYLFLICMPYIFFFVISGLLYFMGYRYVFFSMLCANAFSFPMEFSSFGNYYILLSASFFLLSAGFVLMLGEFKKEIGI